MLTFNNIGNLGRLANQMFQYASLKGIARNRGFEFAIPPEESFGETDLNVRNEFINLYNTFPAIKNNTIGVYPNRLNGERMHTFDEDLFNNCPDNIDLFGYFQTEKYFKHIEDEIREDFKFSQELTDMCKEVIDGMGGGDTISLHIRRGDYVVNPNHPVQPLEYYDEALKCLPQNFPVIVFSDDPKWCHEQGLFSGDRFNISDDNSADFDLCLMSMCKCHVIANSSYSWWGAWLANSQMTIAPKNWFGAQCASKDISDMEFGSWKWI